MSESMNPITEQHRAAIEGSSYSDYHNGGLSSPPPIKTDTNHAATACTTITETIAIGFAAFIINGNWKHRGLEDWWYRQLPFKSIEEITSSQLFALYIEHLTKSNLLP
jgi:hypothetical protein